ncbi:MAG: hypothetical protein OXM55_00115 [Bdellovibrionales bacterium]|nr:hypothetical protein [Bdellovibrionales bacterium]
MFRFFHGDFMCAIQEKWKEWTLNFLLRDKKPRTEYLDIKIRILLFCIEIGKKNFVESF